MISSNSAGGWQKTQHPERVSDDLYPTPAEATQCLLYHVQFTGAVWECASGMGDISQVVINGGYEIVNTDLRASEYKYGEEQDFLTSTEAKAPNIVTNPPYTLLKGFLNKALTIPGIETASFFIPMPALSKVYMQRFFAEFGMPTLILAMTPLFKIYMGEERGTQLSLFAHCWIHWDLRHEYKRTSSEFKSVNWREDSKNYLSSK